MTAQTTVNKICVINKPIVSLAVRCGTDKSAQICDVFEVKCTTLQKVKKKKKKVKQGIEPLTLGIHICMAYALLN